MIIKHIKIPQSEAEQIQKWLDSNEAVPDSGKNEIIKKWSVNFDGNLEADIKLVNTESGPYLDCVLFEDGSEVGLLEPQYVLLGVYPFEHGDKKFTVIIESDVIPCRCPDVMNDEFQCVKCHEILDIEDSISSSDRLICPNCKEKQD